ncbi:hypothetical protein SHIRM173S_00774 [Streptomyces hirsutus]
MVEVPGFHDAVRAHLRASMALVASAFHGAKRLDQACLAQPGEEMFRCTSPGVSPIQYMVARCPTGYEVWVCSTSLGCAVVPEVKYSIRGSSARVGPSGA